MFEYRNRKLNINEKLLKKYKECTGGGLTSSRIDMYIYSKYIKRRDQEASLANVVAWLSDDEIVNEVERKIRFELGFYTGDGDCKKCLIKAYAGA